MAFLFDTNIFLEILLDLPQGLNGILKIIHALALALGSHILVSMSLVLDFSLDLTQIARKLLSILFSRHCAGVVAGERRVLFFYSDVFPK